MKNILLGITGSVAAIKVKELVQDLSALGSVKIVATNAGRYFIGQSHGYDPKYVDGYCYDPIHVDKDEWPENYKLGDPILHIELRKWASCFVIAPLDANTLAKLTHGMCDNLLTSVYRAWDHCRPVIVAPSMNTMMWENDPTSEQIGVLRSKSVNVVSPISKRLACNDVGMGAMAPIEEIVAMVKKTLQWYFPLQSCNGIPINHHPGAFGFHRKKNHHTGVDLYCKDGSPVYAVESGRIVKIDKFTGPSVGHDWWEETWAMMVEGASGVVNYGEITPADDLQVGMKVSQSQLLGYVKRVLFADRYRPDIPGHACSMLHLELYKHGSREFADWHDVTKNPDLLDPTKDLLTARFAPEQTLTWDNPEGKTAG